MEWRQQTSVSCADAFCEAQRWIEEVTGKSFGSDNFRAALENGVLLCDLINQLKPGIIKRVNRLSTPIAGLDNVSVFLKACGKLGLNDSQLFHPGDLQDLSTRVTLRRDESTRRLKNVLITIYWLGRKAHLDAFYNGPQLNFKAFEGLLGLALSKALDEGSNVKDGGSKESRYPEKEECHSMRSSYKKGKSVDSIDFLGSLALRSNSEGFGSDAEAEQVYKMENTQPSAHQNKGYIPPPILRRKQGREETRKGYDSPLPRSKSLSDIPMVYPVRKDPDGDTIYDEGPDNRKCSVAAKDSEAQWQDDLTKWKNRCRSTKWDLRRKSQDREHVINQMSNGAVKNAGGLMKRDQQSPWRHKQAPRPYSTSPPSKPSSSDLRPHTRALLARSYAIESPFSPHNSAHTGGSSVRVMPASDGNILGEETYFASVASDGAGVATPSLDQPFSTQIEVKSQGSPPIFQSTLELTRPENVFTSQISTLVTQPNGSAESTSNRGLTSSTSNYEKPPFSTEPDAVNQAEVDALEDLSYQNHKSNQENQKSSWEPAVDQGRAQQAAGVYKYLSRAGTWSGSASLPRGFRRSEGSTRLSSAITARPFGTKQSRMSSLPRLCSVDDNQGVLLNSEKEDSLSSPTKSSLIRQTATAHLKGQNQASVTLEKVSQAKRNAAEQGKEVNGASLPSRASFHNNGYSHLPSTQILPQPYSNLHTSHRNKNATPPSNATTDFPKVDHSDMRVSLALKPNSVPDFGFHTHWDSTGARVKLIQPGSPAELCRLRVDDEIVAVDGVPVTQLSYDQWKDKMASALQSGNLTMDIRRYGNKDWSTSDGSHHSLPGQSRVTLNLTAAAPVLIGCPDHHANGVASAETTVTKVSKFNGQSDNVIQGKVMGGVLSDNLRTARSKDYIISRKNQKRRAEFFKQKGGSESAISDLQVPSLSPSTFSWSWDREEDRRRQEKWQEEQERLLQEQYQRDQERLEAEWRKAQQDVMGVLKSGNTFEINTTGDSPAGTQLHVNGLANKSKGEELSPDRGELKDAGGKLESNVQGLKNDKMAEEDWADGSCGFAQLSPAHRAKSLSTPVLTASQKQAKDDQMKRKGQSVSKAEQERQQILQEMKKRTQLLTDNSWIRQRSSSFYKEPIYVGVPMKRYESLDNLDALRQSPISPAMFPSYPRPHSAAAGFCAPSRNSCSRYSTGAILSQRNASMDSSTNGCVWAAVDISEEQRAASRFESETGSPTVSSAISNSSTLVPSPCDQLAVLQIEE